MMPTRQLFGLVALVLFSGTALAMKEPKTGINFPSTLKGAGSLTKLGVRTKGPVKVYAVGQYDGGPTFLLQMARGVGAEKMSSALADAIKPRCGDADAVEEFKEMLVKGLPNGAPKGLRMAFGTGGGKLSLTINDKSVGCVKSNSLAKAFVGVYSDKKAVCKMLPVEDTE
uniref:Chalcone isomerase domain-containing protein n=1 Tax=Trieres chinensis TaxID=1514140 RepID=A0A6U1TFT8_TRICV